MMSNHFAGLNKSDSLRFELKLADPLSEQFGPLARVFEVRLVALSAPHLLIDLLRAGLGIQAPFFQASARKADLPRHVGCSGGEPDAE